MLGRVQHWFRLGRDQLAIRMVQWLLGRDAREAFREAMFRRQGEVHRWMYDRYSLMHICGELGYSDFRICRADVSMISGFEQYQLDHCGEEVRKPDSLFVECRKARQIQTTSLAPAA